MHELSLAAEIVDLVKERIPSNSKLSSVSLSSGALSCVNPDSLRFCLQAVLEKEYGPEVNIQVTSVPACLLCLECSARFETEDMYQPCPDCGSLRRKVISGRDLTVDSIEIVEDSSR